MSRAHPLLASVTALALLGCGGTGGSSGGGTGTVTPTPNPTPPPPPAPPPPPPPPTTAITSTAVATLADPWAMTFLPDGRLLVTEQQGRLRVVTQAGTIGAPIAGLPAARYAGQGGLLDVALDPNFASNNRVYVSYSEPGTGTAAGTALARGTLVLDSNNGGRIDNVTVLWRQTPKISNDERHYGARIAFSPDGFLFMTAGERHQGAPSQDRQGTLGKIIRLNLDGTIPATNPFTDGRTEIWSLGHRNQYGLVFATDGRLFSSEHGPSGGDEFNLVTRGANYGWRTVSEGNDGEVLPRHSTRPDFVAPLISWTPAIAPSGMIQYTGTRFVGWQGDFVQAGLVSQGLVQIRMTGSTATEVRRVGLGARIREVEQGPDGAIWVLEDGAAGRLLKLVPQ